MKRLVLAAAMGAGLAACGPADTAEHAERMFVRCESVVELDRIAACSSVIASAQATREQRSAAYVQRGILRGDLGDHGRAVADFGRALRVNPRNTLALYQRGELHEMRGAYQAALRDFDLALAIDPNMQEALMAREAALDGQQQTAASQLAQLDELLAADPTNAELLNNRCWLRAINNENLDLALADCNAALLSEPSFAAAMDSRGLVQLKRGAYAASIADYEAALATDPGRGHYLFGRGLARIRSGLVAEGRADLAAAERAEPGVTAAYASYGVEL